MYNVNITIKYTGENYEKDPFNVHMYSLFINCNIVFIMKIED